MFVTIPGTFLITLVMTSTADANSHMTTIKALPKAGLKTKFRMKISSAFMGEAKPS